MQKVLENGKAKISPIDIKIILIISIPAQVFIKANKN
jgi:hypothetical protein